jgi:uncharacterized membrane protein YesL
MTSSAPPSVAACSSLADQPSRFADVLVLGLLTTVTALPLITAPAALAAAAAVVLRWRAGEEPGVVGTFFSSFGRHLSASWPVGAGYLGGSGLVAVALLSVVAGIPGAPVLALALVVVVLGAGTLLLMSAVLVHRHADRQWRRAFAEAADLAAAAPWPTARLALVVACAAAIAWLVPLVSILLPGLVVMAVVARLPGDLR